MDEIALKRAIAKGASTQKLIDTYQELWDDVEAELWKLWKNSKSSDKDGREDLYREFHAIKVVQARLKRIVDAGKKAENEINEQRLKHGN